MSLRGGQSIEDKLQAVRYFISGQGLSFVVLKATTSEILGPKKKHLNYLVTITNEPNVSIPSLVKYLMQRACQPEWTIVFKSLITIHHLMSFASERFIQNMASSTANHRHFEALASFVDRTTTTGFNMSTFVRRYSRYLNVKIHAYRNLGLDFCKIKSLTSEWESSLKLKTFTIEQLITILPTLQGQFDSLVAFDASPKDLSNGIINSAFAMLYRDFVKLYIVYQTAIIRLLELYFQVTQVKRAQELFEAYKRFLVRMDKVSDFMRVIDSVGIDKSDMPNVSRAPSLSLQILEKHLKQLEGSNKRHSQQSLGTIQPVELPKIGYATMQGSRRSSRTPNKLPTGLSIDNNNTSKSPEVVRIGQKMPVERLLSEQLELTIEEDSSFDKKMKDCDSNVSNVEPDKGKEASRYESTGVPYDLLTNGNHGYLTSGPSTVGSPSLGEQQKDLIIMTDPSDEIQSAMNEAPGGCKLAPVHPAEWVRVDL